MTKFFRSFRKRFGLWPNRSSYHWRQTCCCTVKGEEGASSESDSSDDDEVDDAIFERQELASDEDEIDEESAEYLEMLQKKVREVHLLTYKGGLWCLRL